MKINCEECGPVDQAVETVFLHRVLSPVVGWEAVYTCAGCKTPTVMTASNEEANGLLKAGCADLTPVRKGPVVSELEVDDFCERIADNSLLEAGLDLLQTAEAWLD